MTIKRNRQSDKLFTHFLVTFEYFFSFCFEYFSNFFPLFFLFKNKNRSQEISSQNKCIIYFRVENTISWNCNGRNHQQIQGKATEQTLHPHTRMALFYRNLNKQKRTPTKLTKRIYQRNIKNEAHSGSRQHFSLMMILLTKL